MYKAIPLLVTVLLFAAGPAASEERIFKFQRTGTYGLTVVWSGVVASVNGNKVTPRFVLQNRVFFSRWKDYHAYAIQACKRGAADLGPQTSYCIESKEKFILIPEGSTPYQYDYKFKFKKDGTDVQESFALVEQTNLPDTEEIKWN